MANKKKKVRYTCQDCGITDSKKYVISGKYVLCGKCYDIRKSLNKL